MDNSSDYTYITDIQSLFNSKGLIRGILRIKFKNLCFIYISWLIYVYGQKFDR